MSQGYIDVLASLKMEFAHISTLLPVFILLLYELQEEKVKKKKSADLGRHFPSGNFQPAFIEYLMFQSFIFILQKDQKKM